MSSYHPEMVMASFENTFWTYGVFTAPVKQRPVWGLYHAGKHRARMKNSVPFNFVSFTAAPLLPLPEHKQIKCAYVIHLLCYQTVPLLGSALRPKLSHWATRLLLADISNSGNISTPQGYLLPKLKKWRREMEHWWVPSLSGYRLVECIYFLVGGRKHWSGSGTGRLMMKIRFWENMLRCTRV